jgi:Protein of unknown function (DUF2934)
LNTFLRARNLPPGPQRDELRQLAYGLLRLYRVGIRANVLFSSINRTQEVSMATEQQIRDRAQTLWEKAGRPAGRDLEFSYAAEAELNAAKSEPDAPNASDQPNKNILPG